MVQIIRNATFAGKTELGAIPAFVQMNVEETSVHVVVRPTGAKIRETSVHVVVKPTP